MTAADDPAAFRVITLEALVHMKLVSNRDKDRTHIRDLVGVGLIDRSWLAKLPPVSPSGSKGSSTRRMHEPGRGRIHDHARSICWRTT